MPIEEAEELARELSEFGYRETDDPDEADRQPAAGGRIRNLTDAECLDLNR
jgi:hypothetical protein